MQATHTDREAGTLAAIRELRPIIEAHRADSDTLRRQHDDVVQAIIDRDLFRMMLPGDLGGGGCPPETYLRAVEKVSAMDGSAGWNLAIGAGGAAFAGFMEPALAREVWATREASVPGMLAPNGRAVARDGGYDVTGRWGWGSGIHSGTWALFGCLVFDGDELRKTPEGAPVWRQMLLPRGEYEILDTWHTGGMRGTGSTECAVAGAFVPENRSLLIFLSEPQHADPLFRLPPSYFGVALSVVTLGIARAAIDALVELAGGKTPMLSPNLLRDKQHVQHDVAQAEAMLGSARTYLYDRMARMWEYAVAGDPTPMDLRASTRGAITHAAATSARVVDMMYALAGGSAVFESNAFERCHRDVHAALGHIVLGRGMTEDAGRVRLGLKPNSPMF